MMYVISIIIMILSPLVSARSVMSWADIWMIQLRFVQDLHGSSDHWRTCQGKEGGEEDLEYSGNGGEIGRNSLDCQLSLFTNISFSLNVNVLTCLLI